LEENEMRKKEIDEMMESKVHEIGYQTRILLSILLMLDIFYKIFVLQEDISNWIVEALIFVVAYGYFVCKCTFSGLIVLPQNKVKKYEN
jgi:hypothetical protein